ncbi:MAG: thermonuclease family protein [bacterium]
MWRLVALLAAPLLVAPLLVFIPPPMVWAHPGALDEFGGHFDQKTRKYHYHRPGKSRVSRKLAVLSWVNFKKTGVMKGWVEKFERPNALWIRLDYRPAYVDLAPLVSKSNRDDEKELLRVWMTHVSPEETGRLSKKFSTAFNRRVLFELTRKAAGKRVSVHFDVLGSGGGRLRGLAFLEAENLNLWLVSSGWSFYVLADGENKYDKLFREAEDHARRKKSGIWRAIK